MKKLFVASYLFIAGLVMISVGVYIAVMTTDYMAAMTAQNAVPSINMLSDLRGMGGLLLVLGIYVIVSVFRKTWQKSSLMIATAVYISFVIFRSLSFVLDGMPEMAIMAAYLIEFALAALGVLLIKQRGFRSATGKPLIS